MSVENLQDYVGQIAALACADDEVLIFRGHANAGGFRLLPSVLRDARYKTSEHRILRELVAAHPNEFATDVSTFEQLARVQHYSLPTRLLDASWNPLVALFFATNELVALDGQVIVVRIKKRNVKFYDSDTVSCIANLAHLSLEEKDSINFGLAKSEFNEQWPIDRLLQFIRAEKPYFRANIEPPHLRSVIAVKPKLNNRRLLAQSGAFLLFGLTDAMDVAPVPGIQVERIDIPADKKQGIRAELDRMAINNWTMFPEIEKAALYIRDRA